MIQYLSELDPIPASLLAGLFTWSVTALGAAFVIFTRYVNQRIMDSLLGMAAGVMLAASYWSLLAPAIEMSEGDWRPATVGFLAGGLFLYVLDKLLPHLHIGAKRSEAEGIPAAWRRSVLLVSAITLHNIPEGLAVGVAFGGAVHGIDGMTVGGAVALALGIGIQNLPEGLAVSIPLRHGGMGRMKAFLWGQASGAVEPMAAVLGAAVVLLIHPLLPYALAFAAGAMIFVVVEELIPEAQRCHHADLATVGTLAGFVFMMVLDVALG